MKAAKLSSDQRALISRDCLLNKELVMLQTGGARNRSLVLRQTPVWAQSLALILIGVGSIGVIGGIFLELTKLFLSVAN